jgi:16S rRNA pseudouridine516 synthase
VSSAGTGTPTIAAAVARAQRTDTATLGVDPPLPPSMPQVRLAQVLFSQGFGTRRECDGLVRAGRVKIKGEVIDDPDQAVETDRLVFSVDGVDWPHYASALIVLNKPAGYECSQRPSHHPGVLSLLPPPLRTRGVQPVGRLDADTTGLLLLTDDGALIHRLTSPKRHVPKVYAARCAAPVTDEQVRRLLDGVLLRDDPHPVRAQHARATGTHTLELTLTEGKYHQVKRMVAAAGNHVEALHRSRFGALALPADLAPGQWHWLDDPRAVLGD